MIYTLFGKKIVEKLYFLNLQNNSCFSKIISLYEKYNKNIASRDLINYLVESMPFFKKKDIIKIIIKNNLSNDVQNFENKENTVEQSEEEVTITTEEVEENYEPVIVQEEPAELAPANINDPIVEKKIVYNSPILPKEEQNSISEEQLVERKEEPRSYIEEKKKITRFCDECGTMVTDDGVVCPECGMPIK